MNARLSPFFSHTDVDALSLTASEVQHLQQQSIDHQHPGNILHDFQVLLDFLTPNGTNVSSAHNFLPMKSLADLNQRFSHPLAITLKRPQQKSFPYIHGLYLLLRTSGLTLVQAKGKKQQLVLDEVVLNAWHQLNLTDLTQITSISFPTRIGLVFSKLSFILKSIDLPIRTKP